MIVKFPDLDTLRLALTSAAIPAEVAQKAAIAGFGEQDQLWVETAAKLSATAQKELKRLGALVCKSSDAALSTEVSSWLELLPLVADDRPLDTLEQTPVLFDVPGGEPLSHLVVEMLRLGNDRQSFRWLEENSDSGRALLRVVGPPYYSLLRAIDQLGGAGVAPHAFIERAPGVWVELGYTHPLATTIRPPKGKILLLRPPRQWLVLPDAPFRDVYEIVEFQLPEAGMRWQDSPLQTRLAVMPRLRQSGPSDGAELWVLRGEAIDELNRFVQNAEDQLLTRLAFAVGEKNGQTIVVLRVRQSKMPPPVLVLPAEAYRSYLKLSNLFLPVGTHLHPPLRRDVVRKLLAEDVGQITWLAAGDKGTFTPQSLPEDVFRPLTDWVDYVLERDKDMLQAWVQAIQFDFEPFICNDETPAKPKKPPTEKPRGSRSGEPHGTNEDEGARTAFEVDDKATDNAAPEAELEAFAAVETIEPSELEKVRRAVEEEFLSLPGSLDDDVHQALWPRLADLNTRLGNTEEAGLCWLNALWEPSETADERIDQWTAGWLRAETLAVSQRVAVGSEGKHSWIARFVTPEGILREIPGEDLDLLLQTDEPSMADLRALAAYLVWSARRSQRPVSLMERLQRVQRLLEQHEKLLPVRACWLAWYHLVQLLDGDVLALARARDRLLERLFHNGLRPEQDLPSFLRFAGQPTSQRFRDVREWMKDLCDKAHDWVKKNPNPMHKPLMAPYVDLVFSFGMARLGEADTSKQLLRRAREGLHDKDAAHTFLLGAFEYRITEALNSNPHKGPLPAKEMDKREGLTTGFRYVVDRLRKHSFILEPDQRIDPYSHWFKRMSDLDSVLVEVSSLVDREEISTRVQQLLKECPRGAAGAEQKVRILRMALEVAPRVGEEFAKEMLGRALAAYDALPPLDKLADDKKMPALDLQAKFLEKALFTAAHFDRTEHIHTLIDRFRKMFETLQGPKAIEMVEQLAGQCFRSLRKLGMRDQIDRLLTQMANVILEGKDLDALVKSIEFKRDHPAPLMALLHVADSWYYFGRHHQADPVLQMVRSVLLKTEFPPLKQKDLACVYARTLGQAAVEVAKKRLEEIFSEVKGIFDSFSSCTHVGVCQLDLIESVVLAVVSDDFTQGAQARRWLDEDEFLVRRRIHDDHRKIVDKGD